MSNRPVAILGGGNGGHMMAGDLALAGYQVNFYEHPRFADAFQPALQSGKVRVKGIGRTGEPRLNCVTTDMAQALEDVELINLVVPAFAHELFFAELIPHLRPEHTVVVWAGDFGSLRLRYLLEQQRPDLSVRIAETHTLPYGTRLTGPGEVELFLSAPRIALSALPASHTERVLEDLVPLFPVLRPIEHVLAAAISNPNPVCHPPGSLLNTGRIQYSGGDFYMYREGVTEAVARVIRQVYEETAALARALDSRVLEYEERDFRTPGSIMAASFQAPFNTLGVIGQVQGPKSVQDRYITEDLPYGLVPMSQLGQVLGVETPLMDAFIALGNAVCQRDFWREGRTLETLGLGDLVCSEILELVN